MLEDTCAKLRGLIASACSSCTADAIALSGGLDSTILAYMLKEKKPKCIAVIASDFVATDLAYCQMASKELGVQLAISHTSTADMLDSVEETVKILGNFNDIEIRNSIVMHLAIQWARRNQHAKIITGDGADELFAGYDFLLRKSPDELKEELDRISRIMHFPAQQIGKSLGVTVEAPFLNSDLAEFAKSLPPGFKVRKEGDRVYGKWILRKAFEGLVPRQIAWRAKSPMQDGAGTFGLAALFDSVIDDETFKQEKNEIQENDGITIRTKESLHYYKTYRRIHGVPAWGSAGRACPYCGFEIKDSKFCRMCGAFPV